MISWFCEHVGIACPRKIHWHDHDHSNADGYYTDEDLTLFSTTSYSSDSSDSSIEVAFDDILSIIYLNLILCLFILAIYSYLRGQIPSIYMGRNKHVSPARRVKETDYVWWNPLNFVPETLNFTWRQTREICGLDQYMFLRFVHMCSNIAIVSSFWGVIIMFPVYYTSHDGEDKEGWYLFSMANIAKGSQRLWAPFFFMVSFTTFTVYMVNAELRHYVELRMEFLARGEPDLPKQHHHSLIVEKIPANLRSDKALYDYFDAIFPGRVHSASVLVKVPDLESRVKRRDEVCKRLEKALAFLAATSRRPTHIVGKNRCRCCGIECAPYRIRYSTTMHGDNYENFDDDLDDFPKGQRADSIRYYTLQLEELNQEVRNLQQEKLDMAEVGNQENVATDWLDRVLRADLQFWWNQEAATSGQSVGSTVIEEDSVLVDSLTNKKTTENTDALSLLSSIDDPLIVERPSVVDHARPGIELEGKGFFEMFFRFLGGTFFLDKLRSMKKNVDVVVDGVLSTKGLSSTGFVTFTNLTTVTAAASAPFTTEPNALLVSIAPEPRDIHWKNATVDDDTQSAKQQSGEVLVIIGAILWSIPVATIQIWFTADSLSEIKGFGWMSASNNENVATFVNTWLPVVTLMILMTLLPYVFQYLATKYENRKTYSNIENSILRRYFLYQLANVYITVTSYSIFDSLNDIIDDPGDTTRLLGETLPTVVGYFVALIVTKTMVGIPVGLLRTGSLARYSLLRTIFCSKSYLTQRELDVVEKRLRLRFGREYPSVLLVMIICQCYATIAPVILPFAALFFVLAFVVYKHQCIHVFASKYESGGLLFPVACHRLLVGLLFAELTLIGYMSLREGYAQATLLTPVLFYTYNHMQYFHNQYQIPSMYLTLERAQDIDKHEKNVADVFDSDAYRQPILREHSAEPQEYRRVEDDLI